MSPEKVNQIKKLKQLRDVGKLYDCRIRCLLAFTWFANYGNGDYQIINSLFDTSKTCSNLSIREFLCEIIPNINMFCVCDNFDEKIKKMMVDVSSFEEKKKE